MARTVYKYELNRVSEPQKLNVPKGGKVLAVDYHWGSMCVWIEVDPTHGTEVRTFHVYGTGHPIEPGHVYCGTVLEPLPGLELVWHIYEEVRVNG